MTTSSKDISRANEAKEAEKQAAYLEKLARDPRARPAGKSGMGVTIATPGK
jgi:hypothetical protein